MYPALYRVIYSRHGGWLYVAELAGGYVKPWLCKVWHTCQQDAQVEGDMSEDRITTQIHSTHSFLRNRSPTTRVEVRLQKYIYINDYSIWGIVFCKKIYILSFVDSLNSPQALQPYIGGGGSTPGRTCQWSVGWWFAPPTFCLLWQFTCYLPATNLRPPVHTNWFTKGLVMFSYVCVILHVKDP